MHFSALCPTFARHALLGAHAQGADFGACFGACLCLKSTNPRHEPTSRLLTWALVTTFQVLEFMRYGDLRQVLIALNEKKLTLTAGEQVRWLHTRTYRLAWYQIPNAISFPWFGQAPVIIPGHGPCSSLLRCRFCCEAAVRGHLPTHHSRHVLTTHTTHPRSAHTTTLTLTTGEHGAHCANPSTTATPQTPLMPICTPGWAPTRHIYREHSNPNRPPRPQHTTPTSHHAHHAYDPDRRRNPDRKRVRASCVAAAGVQ